MSTRDEDFVYERVPLPWYQRFWIWLRPLFELYGWPTPTRSVLWDDELFQGYEGPLPRGVLIDFNDMTLWSSGVPLKAGDWIEKLPALPPSRINTFGDPPSGGLLSAVFLQGIGPELIQPVNPWWYAAIVAGIVLGPVLVVLWYRWQVVRDNPERKRRP